MFAIYGVSGPVFQGTLEALNRMPPVARRTPVTPAQRISDNVEIESATARGAGANRLGAQAIEAYKSMLPEDLDRGPLYHADQIMTPNVIAVRARSRAAGRQLR